MTQIRDLFDSSRKLNRRIEKVITYQNRSEAQLQAEISEYVVTDHIEESFSELLKKMQLALQGGGGHEIGVWISGFYGSGKSSFTKYLGFALDRNMKLGEEPFLRMLQNQLRSASVKALFNQVATTYDATVIFLDLASEMLAGASMEDVSTVLHLKVLQWAGYSEDLKVAELERMLEMDGKFDSFLKSAKQKLDGVDWSEVRNQSLVTNCLAAVLATEFYPKLFPKVEDFQNLSLHVNKSEIKRVEEMIELIRRKSGKKNIFFIVDEVGQYVSAKPNLILNLDGLAKNLKQIGNGTVWLFATAQQTLTEDNPSAILNAPGLFKLKGRFPIEVNLEASDIREICHKRLLTKSASGEKELGAFYDSFSAPLRNATQLKDAGVYEAELGRKTFIDLYPFLPSHFEILLQLLGRLARKTGGFGLRSAIKVLQDVLVERGGRTGNDKSLADMSLGTLANTVTFYDSLHRDIHSSYPFIVDGVERVRQRFPKEPQYLEIAKSIAVLQILENLPVTVDNIAALLQPAVNSQSLKDSVQTAVTTLLKDSMIPLGEKNGSLRFLTQAAVTLQKQFDEIEYRQADVRAALNGVYRTIFKPLPSTRLSGVRPVTAGLKVVIAGGQAVSLEGDKETIQVLIETVPSGSYETTRTERENDSRSTRERSNIFLIARSDSDIEQLGVTLARCEKFLNQNRTASDSDTKDFVRIVEERQNRTAIELERKLHAALFAGSFVALGDHKPVSEFGASVLEATKVFLAEVAAFVYDRYNQAPIQADSGLAEKFLKTQLDRITNNEDPLSLVSRTGGKPRIKNDHKAIISIKDYLGQQGLVEGRRILDHFADPPFGWSKDTTRYLLAAAFLGADVKLRIAGHDHLVKNDETLGAFGSNKAISAVGVSLRQERPDPDVLMRASERLRDLTGENILPLEDAIATAAKKYFPTYQATSGPLAMELRSLGLHSTEQADRAENLSSDLIEVVSGDGSDAIKRLGGVDSPLYDSLIWARHLKKTLDNGLRTDLHHLKQLCEFIEDLPTSGTLGKLKVSAVDSLASIADILSRNSFFEEASSLRIACAELSKLVASTAIDLGHHQIQLAKSQLSGWQSSNDWPDLSPEDRDWFIGEVSNLAIEADATLDGLRKLVRHDYDLNIRLRDLAATLSQKATQNRESKSKSADTEDVVQETEIEISDAELLVPRVFKSTDQIDLLVAELNKLKSRISVLKQIRIKWKEIE